MTMAVSTGASDDATASVVSTAGAWGTTWRALGARQRRGHGGDGVRLGQQHSRNM
jgi:hypothetical protein